MTVPALPDPERQRVAASRGNPEGWRKWGPYLSERAWGTVREDYSPDGSAWDYFPHDHARSRTYRWNEDGLAGFCDIRQRLCFAVALWNGRDGILKERLFGLTGPQGNHGEDVKEVYYYLDATPTYSYAKYLYKYPQAEFPYEELVAENGRRGRNAPEYELADAGVFDEGRYFDVLVEYAKAAPDDLLIQITVANRGPDAARLHLLPTLWFRNDWTWNGTRDSRPRLRRDMTTPPGMAVIAAPRSGSERHPLESFWLACEGTPDLLFTENETNNRRLFGVENPSPFVKDAFHEYVVGKRTGAVNPAQTGTKAGALYVLDVPAGGEIRIRLRLSDREPEPVPRTFGSDFDAELDLRKREADAFYAPLAPPGTTNDARTVQRQALAGLLWSKQFYPYDVSRWLSGDPATPVPPPERKNGRNANWTYLSASDVLSLPDKWEYPWFAAWDHAFHAVTLALVDPDFAKHQLLLLCREWYMHPSGQIPAYEWAFGDVNPPVHAWAALRVYQLERKMSGAAPGEPGDLAFLERIFHKLLINFTWWVNRKDVEGNNVFEGGFLGLDNIGVFDRSAALPAGGTLEQSDGTSWMAMFCLNLLAIALELARHDPTYQDVAVKFAEHFVYIAHAMTDIGTDGVELWDEEDGFFYDVLHLPPGNDRTGGATHLPLRVRSMVGLIPLIAVETFDQATLNAAPDFLRRLDWFLRHKPELSRGVAHIADQDMGTGGQCLFSIVNEDRLRRVLRRLLDENEFLSPHGIRALSRWHREHPYILPLDGTDYHIAYEPAESSTGLFGGNSNWRGPIWFPVNYLLIEALTCFGEVYGDTFLVECPAGSGHMRTLAQVADELSRRLVSTFLPGSDGRRAAFGDSALFQSDPHFKNHLLFHEYFHGDTGAGLGASHQTGWTALVANLIARQP